MITVLLCSMVWSMVPQAPVPQRFDIIELLGGESIEGRIVLERGNYLEIELSPNSMVGFRTSQIAAIRRGAGAPVPSPLIALLPPRDEWCTLHDATGKAVGWLHSTVAAAADGGLRLTEEWEFTTGKQHFQVTAIESADAELQPVSCYFRERVSEEVVGFLPSSPEGRAARVLHERIVEAKVEGQVLHLDRLRKDGRDQRELPWRETDTFPLLMRTLQATKGAALVATVFDAAIEELVERSYGADRFRTVMIAGKTVHVTEQVETAGVMRNVIWLDASGRLLRREVSGPSLVALPSSVDLAQAAVERIESQPAAFAVEASGRFGLWLPNPAWQVLPDVEGMVAMRCALHNATISLSVLDQLDAGVKLSSAGESIERWFHLLQPSFRISARKTIKVRDRMALLFEAQGKNGDRDGFAMLVVVPWNDRFLLLRCAAPAAEIAELRPDFLAVVAHLELDGKAITLLLPKEKPAPVAATMRKSDSSAASALAPAADPAGVPSGMPSGMPALAPTEKAAPKKRPMVRLPAAGQEK